MDSGRKRDVEQGPVVTAPEAAQVTATPDFGGPLTAAKVAALQRHAGNAAVSRLLGGAGGRPPARSSAAQVVGRASILDDIASAGGTATAEPPGARADAAASTDAREAAPATEALAGPSGGEQTPAAETLAEPGAGEQAPPSGGRDVEHSGDGATAEAGPAAPAAAPVADLPAPGGAAAVDTASPGAGAPGGASPAAAAAGPMAGGAGAVADGPASAAPAAGGKAAAAAKGDEKAATGGADAAGAPKAEAGPAAVAAPVAPKINKDPHADPAFQAMKGRGKTAAGGAKAHAPAKAGAANAQAAAAPPSNDASSQAQAAQVDEMSTKEPGAFDRAAFIAAVRQAIEAQTPKNLEDADKFKEGGAEGVQGEVSGHVKKGKEGSEKDIKEATTAPPDASKAKPKSVEPMVNDPVGERAATVGASGAMPPPVPGAATDLSGGPDSIDAKMADAEVTDKQLKKSNEPEFNEALGVRDQAKEHSAGAPADYRKDEQGVLGKAKSDAAGLEGAGLQQMQGARGQALGQAVGHKQGAKTADEAKRAKVANDIQGIYDRTKTDVTKTLDGLDGKVDAAFSQGEGAARKRFESYVGAKMDAYKEDRYGGLLGPAKWLKDKLLGMPSDVNRFYAEGKTRYLADMDGVIGRIADIVGAGLTAARARITRGKAEIAKYVAQLPQDLKQVGQEAEEKLSSQFEQLESDVESKQSEMVDTLARKYVESRDALDARIDEMKAANRGLVDKAMDAISGVIKTIIQLKNMLLGVLARAADVIGAIISDPIGFLGNLINGIKAGLSRFVGNIATHLQSGLMGWLTGALGNAGLEMPKTFDVAGIFNLVLQILGLTWQNIRTRVVKVVGEPMMAKLEQTVDLFKVLMTEGVGGLWNFIKDRVGDLEETVVGGIKDFIIEKVIKAGITWLIAFMNPAAAFIKACKAIYDIVMFLIERGSEIMAFVNSVLDSIGAIVKGNIGAVADKVEDSLARALPLAISFLASLLGLGGISDKVRSVIQKVQAPINKAVDSVVMGAVKLGKKLFGKPAKWVKDKYNKGKQWAKDKVQGAKDWASNKVQDVKDRVTGGGKDKDKDKQRETDAPPDSEREARLQAATDEAEGLMHEDGATVDGVRAKLPAIQQRHRLTGLELVQEGEFGYRPKATINPTMRGDLGVLFTPEQLAEMRTVAKQWAAQIKEKKVRDPQAYAVWESNPRRYILGDPVKRKKGKVSSGDAVEAAAGPELEAIAAEGGLTLLRNLQLQGFGEKGPVGGSPAEIDFVLLGPDSIVDVISAKLDPGAYAFERKDRKALRHFYDAPLGGPDLQTYALAHWGNTPVWKKLTRLEAVSSAGSMPLGTFRSTYLSNVPVDRVTISGVSPGPEQPLNRQLRSDAPELIDEMIKLIGEFLT